MVICISESSQSRDLIDGYLGRYRNVFHLPPVFVRGRAGRAGSVSRLCSLLRANLVTSAVHTCTGAGLVSPAPCIVKEAAATRPQLPLGHLARV